MRELQMPVKGREFEKKITCINICNLVDKLSGFTL